MTEKQLVKVFPSPKLHPDEYVKGVGAAGVELSHKEAGPMLDAGLVIKDKSDKPEHPAKPEK